LHAKFLGKIIRSFTYQSKDNLCRVQMMKSIWFLLRKDLLLEWREKNALSAIVLYVLATTFVIYQMFVVTEPSTWVVLYWVITLFAALNASAKSFIQERSEVHLYYYQLVSPQAMIMSKMVFNVILMTVLSILSTAAFGLLLGFPVKSFQIWLIISSVGSVGLALTFTMISAIAAKARNAGVLMTILGLPLVIPQMLVLVDLSKKALLVLAMKHYTGELMALLSIDVIVIVVALVFFPYLWKD